MADGVYVGSEALGLWERTEQVGLRWGGAVACTRGAVLERVDGVMWVGIRLPADVDVVQVRFPLDGACHLTESEVVGRREGAVALQPPTELRRIERRRFARSGGDGAELRWEGQPVFVCDLSANGFRIILDRKQFPDPVLEGARVPVSVRLLDGVATELEAEVLRVGFLEDGSQQVRAQFRWGSPEGAAVDTQALSASEHAALVTALDAWSELPGT